MDGRNCCRKCLSSAVNAILLLYALAFTLFTVADLERSRPGRISPSKTRPHPTLRSGREAGQIPILLTKSRRGRLRRTASARYWCRARRSAQLIQPGAAADVSLALQWLGSRRSQHHLLSLPASVRATVDTTASNITEALANTTSTPCRAGITPLPP